jgi:PAS domain S-box-containing protein
MLDRDPRRRRKAKSQLALFPEALAARHAAAVAEVVRTGRPRVSESVDLGGRWLQAHLRPLKDQRGRVVAVLGVSRDVTAGRQASETQRRYRATVEQALIGIANLSLDGRIISVNERLCRTLGREAEELVGVSLRDALATDEFASEALAQLGRAGERALPLRRELNYVRKDGESVWVLITIFAVRDDEDRPAELVATTQDVSERRLLEERLRQSEKLEAIGQIAGGVAHDFNNQLTAIIGYADLLAHCLNDEHQRRYAASILESARRSAGLTRQLLAFARKGQFQRSPLDLNALLEELCEVLERSIDKRIRIERQLRVAAPIVIGDANLLQNAVLNLALNARDAMPDGGRLTFETGLALVGQGPGPQPAELAPGSYVTLTVSDTGCGMGEAVLSRLFEPFFTTKDPGKGTGLGLAAAFGTARRHGGTITVSSAVGHGSSFRLYLPLAVERQKGEPAPEDEPRARVTGRVLIIDDESGVREMAAELLTAHGFAVATCADGRAAVEHYQRHWHEIDLVVLDLVMPELDGAETFAWIRRINPSARVLLISGYSSDGDAESLLARGALGFLQKPFDTAHFVRTISEALLAPPAHQA